MKFTSFVSKTNSVARNGRRTDRRGRAPLTVAATMLLMGLALCVQATPALCATHIYVATSAGYQDVTSLIATVDGHTYVMTANPYEIVIDLGLGHVYDIDSEIIGFIMDDEVNPPA
jgi:hypothetical protein